MTDWGRGSWTGSLNKLVSHEVRDHFSTNTTARRARYPWHLRALRSVFFRRSFGQFIVIYAALNLGAVLFELALARIIPDALPSWTASGPPGPDIKTFLTNVASYLVTAQVGVLGVISIAVGLVTLIAQRDGSNTDVQLYYHESLAFEVVASCIALLVILCIQLVWPLQFILHRSGEGTSLQIFKLTLLCIHIAWLTLNLSALAHFVATTFRFVQQSAREELRERYIANFVLPREMTKRLREQLYHNAGDDFLPTTDGLNSSEPSVAFGFEYGDPEEIEIERKCSKPIELKDVRMKWARWAVQNWARRCKKIPNANARARRHSYGNNGPILSFPIYLDNPGKGKIAWCRRRGGVKLNWLERSALHLAFRFKRSADEE